MQTILAFVLLSVAACATSAFAATAEIAEVQLPAWLERGGSRVPAEAGIALLPGDTLRTGTHARMLLKLGDGSAVRLGENAHFAIEAIVLRNGVYQAALDVVQGAFRFTTAALARAQPREVNIRVARNATIGIRGTDVWGRGRDDKDIVCLIEGKVDVTGNDGKALRMDQPLQFFQSTRTAPPAPLAFVDAAQLAIWSAETDIETGKGTRAGAPWQVVIGGFAGRDAALATRQLLRAAGYPAEVGATAGTLAIGQLAGETEAHALADELKAGFALTEVSVRH